MLDMKRRKFIALVGGGGLLLAAKATRARAQPSGKTYRIGFLGVFSYEDYRRLIDAMGTRLRQLGYEDGKNIVIQYRWAEGRYDRLPELAAELVKLNLDVLVTHSTPGALAAKQATSAIPIVVAAVGDPTDSGLVASLARPGGNLTGLTFFYAETCAKRVELLKEAIPALTRIAIFVNPANPGTIAALPITRDTASALGVELVPVELKSRDDIAGAIDAVAGGARALVVIEEPLIISNAEQIAGLALQNRVPMAGFTPHAQAGALMDYGVDLVELYARAAVFVDKILKGTPPADIPIERAVKFDLTVNLKTAKILGLELPPTLLIRANEVIE
jgi:putative ABC transport system substrate-binding protein